MRRLPLIVVVLVALVGASSASAHPTSVTVTLTGTPNPVTASGTVAYVATLKNSGSKELEGVNLTAPAPAGMSVVTVISAGTCTSSAATAQCAFGGVAAGASVSATVVTTTPSTPGAVSSSVTWSTQADDHHHSYSGHDDDKGQTFTASTSISVQAASPNAISKYVLPAGGTVSTGSTTSATNPQSTTATVPATPAGAATSVSEVNAASPTDACGPSATCFGQISVVTVAAPAFSATAPLHLAFVLDSSEIPPYTDPNAIPMYHDGIAVPNCTGYGGVASPDPCISARIVKKPPHCHKGQFSVEIDVLSSTNGRWRA